MVFLPSSAPVGKNVRVKLVDTGRKDHREMTLFRAEPAPIEYTERWKDNGDGTASRVKIATDWLLQESQAGVLETRPLVKRDGTPSIQSNLQVVWGQDLVSSVIEDSQVRLIPLEEEKVESGQIVWRKTGERQEPIPTTETYPISKIELGYCQLNTNRLQVTYDPNWSVQATVNYRKPSSSYDSSYSLTATWTAMPKWWQQEWEARYPVCQCGRQRRDTQVADAYGKCELCRAEETCVRCGKKTTVKNLSGRLVCHDCEPYEAAEQMIETKLPRERREAIASEARKIRSGQALVQAEGEVVLKATVDHITDSWTRDRIVGRWTGYGWYYFADDGVYGTKLAPAALSIIEFLPHASGNGLVELVAWLALGPKPGSSSDYYTRTQVKGEKVALPPLEDTIQKLAEGTLVLADRLRGSEADRVAALAGYQTLVEKLGKDSSQAKAVVEILQGNEQDYAKAAQLMNTYYIREADRKQKAAAGELLLDVVVSLSHHKSSRDPGYAWAIAEDGTLIQPLEETTYRAFYGDLPTTVLVLRHYHSNYGYTKYESWEVVHKPTALTQVQKETVEGIGESHTLHEYFRGRGTGWELSKQGTVVYATPYYRDFQGKDREALDAMLAVMPVDVSEYETHAYKPEEWEEEQREETNVVRHIIVGPYKHRDPRTVRLTELRTQLDELQTTLQGVEMNWEYEKQEHDQALELALERMDAQYGKRPVADGDVFEVTFHEEERQGQTQLVAGPIYDEPSASWIKFVLDPYQRVTPKVGQTCLVRVRAKNSQQLHLFAYRIDNPEGRQGRGGRVVSVYGYFAQPIYGESDHQSEIAEIKAQIAKIEGEITKVETEPVKGKPTASPSKVLSQSWLMSRSMRVAIPTPLWRTLCEKLGWSSKVSE